MPDLRIFTVGICKVVKFEIIHFLAYFEHFPLDSSTSTMASDMIAFRMILISKPCAYWAWDSHNEGVIINFVQVIHALIP